MTPCTHTQTHQHTHTHTHAKTTNPEKHKTDKSVAVIEMNCDRDT